MNEKIKKIFYVIGSFIVGIVSTLFGFLLHHRGTTNRVTNDNINTKDTIDNTKRGFDNAQSTVDNITEQSEHIEQSTDRAGEILQTIREKQQIKAD